MSVFSSGRFQAAIGDMADAVANNRITIREGTFARRELADLLCRNHNERPNDRVPLSGYRDNRRPDDPSRNRNPGSNKMFLGNRSISVDDCAAAMATPQTYRQNSDWDRWAGYHAGHWYYDSGYWVDNARWFTGRDEPSRVQMGPQRTYRFQPVEFYEDTQSSVRRLGWNQSHSDLAYVWGWDPKEAQGATDKLKVGPHIGYPFSTDQIDVIVWITPTEAFLECVGNVVVTAGQTGPSRTERRRTSAASNTGAGQWVVSR